MVKKKKTLQETSAIAGPIVVGETISGDDLRARLEEIKSCQGVIGYILRNANTASIDLDDPAKIIDYAVLSSLAFDVSRDFSQLFDLGELENAIFDGKNIKMLSITIGQNRISIFTEKDTDLEKILMKLHTS